MEKDTITIPRSKYLELKRKAEATEIDWELVEKIRRSLEDIKHGRIKDWKG